MASVRFADCCFLSLPRTGYRLTWEVTQKCPHECEYCFTWSSPKRNEFETPNLGALMEKLQCLIKRAGVKDVLVTGGEPLLVLKRIRPFIESLPANGVTFSVSSTLPNERVLAELCGLGPRAINLSVDPPPQAESAPSAFKARYGAVQRKLEMVAAHGVPLKLTAVVSRDNCAHLPVLLDYLGEALGALSNVEKIAFNRAYPIGYAAEAQPQSKAELGPALRVIQEWARTVPRPEVVSLVNWDEFHKPLQECPAGKSLISVMPDGDVTPCSLLYNLSRSFRVGNLLEDPIEEIMDRLQTFEREIREYSRRTEANTPACARCQLRDSCGGGCPAMLPIASNHISKRTCQTVPTRVQDHERKLLADFHRDLHLGYSPVTRSFAAPAENLSEEVERRIRAYVQRNLRPTDLAHTMEHVDCVVALTKHISSTEGASLKITVPAAYFHDMAPREPAMHHMHTFKSALLAREVLTRLNGFTEEEMTHVQYCIYTSSYGSHLLGYKPLTLEMKVVRDADWLDAIGARGIARVFAFGQAHGARTLGKVKEDPRLFYVGVDMNITGPDPDPISHFYRKLLKIRDLLQTETGKRLGQRRHQLMLDFLQQYREEGGIAASP